VLLTLIFGPLACLAAFVITAFVSLGLRQRANDLGIVLPMCAALAGVILTVTVRMRGRLRRRFAYVDQCVSFVSASLVTRRELFSWEARLFERYRGPGDGDRARRQTRHPGVASEWADGRGRRRRRRPRWNIPIMTSSPATLDVPSGAES
jgi:hypothetical protein